MTIYLFKSRFQNLIRPICKFIVVFGVTPNQVTLTAIILSIVVGWIVWIFEGASWTLSLLSFALLVRMTLNALDGMLAREYGMQSALGLMLNEIGDVLSDAALYLPLAVIPEVYSPMIVVAVVLASVSEMAGVLAAQIGTERRYDGPMGKSDRALAFGLLATALAGGVMHDGLVNIILAGINALLLVTIFRRAGNALRANAA